MQNEDTHINNELLASFLLGETTPLEQQQVIQWLDSNPKNQETLDKLEAVWIKSGSLNPIPLDVNVPEAWNNLQNKIDEDNQKTKNKIYQLRPILYAAASIALVFVLFKVFYTHQSPIEPIVFTSPSANQTDTLPDGSIVTLKQFSKLTYLSNDDDNTREVKLEGEAFFEVRRDTLRPFIISAGMGGIRVLGTSFNVKVINQTDVKVDVKTGLVELFYPATKSKDTLSLRLKAGECGLLSHQQKKLKSQESSPSSMFWHDNTLIFKNESLQEVFQVLEQCYSIDIECTDSNINLAKLSTTFNNKKANEILDVIAATFDISYKIENNTYYIYQP